MKRKDRAPETKTKPQPERPGAPEHTVAPPIEREHETQAGVYEEEEQEKREQERH